MKCFTRRHWWASHTRSKIGENFSFPMCRVDSHSWWRTVCLPGKPNLGSGSVDRAGLLKESQARQVQTKDGRFLRIRIEHSIKDRLHCFGLEITWFCAWKAFNLLWQKRVLLRPSLTKLRQGFSRYTHANSYHNVQHKPPLDHHVQTC